MSLLRALGVDVLRVGPGLVCFALAACHPRENAKAGDFDATPSSMPPTLAGAPPQAAASCITRQTTPFAESAHSAIIEVTVRLDRCRVVPVVAPRLTTLDALAPVGALVGINGGYFDINERPLGLRRIAGVERSAPWAKAHGGVVAFGGARLFVGPRALMPSDVESAVQCKPLLVERDGENGIATDDGRRAARTTACDTGDGAAHFVLFIPAANGGPTLRETAEILRAPREKGGFGCRAALNLDGGPSTGVWFAAGGSTLPPGRIVDGLFVVPR